LIRWAVWGLVFAVWFWIDVDFGDPATLKNLLLPLALPILLVVDGRGIPRSRTMLAACLVFAWAFFRIGTIAPPLETSLFLATGAIAFLVGSAGARPPAWLAVGAGLVAIGKGWDDLVFLRNVGGGIPFTATSFFVHKNIFGLVLAPSILLLVGWSLGGRDDLWRIRIGLVIAAIGAVLLAIGGSAGASLGFLAGAGFVAGCWLWRTSPRRWRLPWAFLLVLVAAGASVAAIHQSGRVRQTVEEARALLGAERIETRVPDRFRPWVWAGAARLWKEAPLEGIGVGDFRYSIESVLDPWTDQYRGRSRKVAVAHSHWMHLLVERGLIGLVLEGLVAFLAIGIALRSGAPFLAGAIVCMAAHGIVAEGLEYPMGAVFWWYLIGMAVSAGETAFLTRATARWAGFLFFALVSFPVSRGFQIENARRDVQVALPRNDASRELLELLRLDPRSTLALTELARVYAIAGDLPEARRALEHLRELYPRLGSVDLEVPLAGVWRRTGRLDSAEHLIGEMSRRYPLDPWIVHEMARIREVGQGCPGVRRLVDSVAPRFDSALRVHRSFVAPSGWRSQLVWNADRARNKEAWLGRLDEDEVRTAVQEWNEVQRLCVDPP